MIDVHILKSDRGFFDTCIQHIKSDHIKLHVIDSSPDYGNKRIEGYSCGEQPYIAAIDDDDIVVPEVFERATQVLKNNRYTAYYSNHYITDINGNVYGQWFSKLAPNKGFSQAMQMHHVVVYRRSVVEPYLQYLEGVKTLDKYLLNLACIYHGEVFGDSFKGLYWRVHDGGMHKKFSAKDNPEEWKRQVKLLQKKILEKDR